MTKAADLSALGSNATTAGNLSSASTLTLQTNSTTALTIDTSQNVGIGTASPARKFQITETNYAQMRMTAGSTYAGIIEFVDNASVTNAQILGWGSTNATPNALSINTAGTERMRIDSSGNLLLGTTTARGNFTIPSQGQIKPAGFTVVSGGANYTGPAAAGQLAFASWNNGSGYALVAFQGTNITTISSSNSAGGNNAFDTTNSFSSNGGNGAAIVVSGGTIYFQTKNNFTAAGSAYIMYLGG